MAANENNNGGNGGDVRVDPKTDRVKERPLLDRWHRIFYPPDIVKNGKAARDEYWKSACKDPSVILAVLLFVIGWSLVLSSAIFSYCRLLGQTEGVQIGAINSFVIWTALLTLIAVGLLNVATVIVANHARPNADIVNPEVPPATSGTTSEDRSLSVAVEALGPNQEPYCEYCGHKGSRIVCGHCDSVLYYRLSGWQMIAVFFAHQRWQVNSVLLGVFLVLPIGGAYEQLQRKKEELKQYETDTKEVLKALNKSRENVMKMAYIDGLPLKEEVAEHFLDGYFEFSWFAPRIFDYFRHQVDGAVAWDQSCEVAAKAFLRTKLDTLELAILPAECGKRWENADPKQIAVFLGTAKIFPKGASDSEDLVEYLDDQALSLSKSLKIGRNSKDSIVVAAEAGLLNRLFYVGKVAGSVLEVLAFNPESKGASDPEANSVEYLRKFLSDTLPKLED